MNDFDSWENELYHYGILGMKWGVRRFQNEDGTLTAEGKKRREKLEDLSDDELKQRIARLKMEKEYRELNVGKVGRTFEYIRKLSKERADIKEKKAKLKTARTESLKANPFYTAVNKISGSVAEAAGKVVANAIKRSGDTFVDMIPDAKAVKSGAKWLGNLAVKGAKNVKPAARKVKSGVKKVSSKAKAFKKNNIDSYWNKRRRKAVGSNPWTW